MIISFRCKETKKVWEGRRSKKLPNEIQDRSLRKLRQLDASICLDDLKNPPGNNLESLGGNREGEMSIRINKQWRICFIWTDKGAILVEITDYH
jgi:proteic killer suppression protein